MPTAPLSPLSSVISGYVDMFSKMRNAPLETQNLQQQLDMGVPKLQIEQAKAKYAEPMQQAEIQQKLSEGLPELMRAYNYYSNVSKMLGPDHPVVQEAFKNYQIIQKSANALAQLHGINAAWGPFSKISGPAKEAAERAALESGGSLPTLPQTTSSIPSVSGTAQGVPMTAPEMNKYTQLTGQPADQSGQGVGQQPKLDGSHIDFTQAAANPHVIDLGAKQLAALNAKPYIESEAKARGEADVKEYNKAQDSVGDLSDDARQMNMLIRQFKDAYNKSLFVGQTKGSMPSSYSNAHGMAESAAYLAAAGHDFTNEINADNAAQNMQSLIIKLMKTNRLTNYELKFASGLKLNRSMNPGNIDDIGDWLTSKSGRIEEMQDFLNSAKDKGVPVQLAKSLWGKYENQRPSYDFQNKKTNAQYQQSWNDYLTPQAINAVKNGEAFTPDVESASDLKYLTPREKLYLRKKYSEVKK